jgi:regulatory protein
MAKLIDKLKSDQEKDIYRKLGHYCAYQERAESEVLNKLESLEVSESLSIRLIELLKKDKFLNNKRFARFYAQGKFTHKKWGKLKIKSNLRQKEISADNIEFALDLIKIREYKATINLLIEKKARSIKDKSNLFIFRKKIVDSIRMKGFEADIVWDLVKKQFPDK